MMQANELLEWIDVLSHPNPQTQCILVVGGGAFADCVRKLHSIWAFDEKLAHNLALDAMRVNARVLRALAPFAHLSSFEDIVARAEEETTLILSPTGPLPGNIVPETWAATSDSIGLYLAQHLSAKALFLVKSLQADTLRAASAVTLSREGVIDNSFPRLFARRPITTKLVSKTQFSDFAKAYRTGDVHGVGVAVTEHRAKVD